MESHKSHEETARSRAPGMSNVLYSLSWFMIVVFGLIAAMLLNTIFMGFDIVPIVIFVISGGLAFLIWRKKDNLRVEYDYTYTHIGGGRADLDVAKVMGNARRRLMTSLSLSAVESAGVVNHPSFQRYLTMKDVKKHNWFVNRGADLFYFYFVKNNVKHMIILELSETMVERVKQHFGHGVWQK